MKKWISLLLSCLIICTSLTGCALNEKDAPEETLHEHSYGAWEVLREADCDSREILVHTCTECGESQNWFGQNATGMHAYDKNNVCTRCGSHFEHDYLAFWAVHDGYAVRLKQSTTPKEISIPEQYQGLPVIKIEDWGFMDCTTFQKVNLPSSLTEIGDSAFANCTALESVTIPSKVSLVGAYSFSNCIALEQVIVKSGVKNIGDYAFMGCRTLKNLQFGTGLLTIGDGAFAECDALVDVVLPSGMKNTGVCTFGWCDSLKSVYYPKSIETIGEGAFYDSLNFDTIYYEGTRYEWTMIKGSDQFPLFNFSIKLIAPYEIGSDHNE